jgi:hypothetical protein
VQSQCIATQEAYIKTHACKNAKLSAEMIYAEGIILNYMLGKQADSLRSGQGTETAGTLFNLSEPAYVAESKIP